MKTVRRLLVMSRLLARPVTPPSSYVPALKFNDARNSMYL